MLRTISAAMLFLAMATSLNIKAETHSSESKHKLKLERMKAFATKQCLAHPDKEEWRLTMKRKRVEGQPEVWKEKVYNYNCTELRADFAKGR